MDEHTPKGDPAWAKLDDLTMVFDLVSRLVNAEGEEQALAQTSEMFTLLFAPGSLVYRPWTRPGLPPWVSDQVWREGVHRLESGRGFGALVRHGQELFGVLEADDLAFPSYLERYLNLAPMVAQACGLAIANARAAEARRRAEDRSRQEQERFRLAFSTSPDAININRLEDGLYVEINQGFTDLTGFTAADVIGRTSIEIDIWADPADRATLVRGLRERGYYENLEARFRRKDGSLTTALMSARVIVLQGVPHIISITRDISERIRNEEEKALLEEQLRQAQKMEAIGTLAGGIAHDFNNILAAIMGFAEMAHDDLQYGQVNPADLRQIMASALRAKELVQQILSFSRKRAPDLRPIDLNQVMSRARAVLERTLPKMVAIETHPAPGLPPIQGDPVQLEQVLLNLAANAADAMPDGGALVMETQLVTLDAEYCRGHLEVRPGVYALFAMSDTGTGMDEETREHIFDPFFTTKEIGKGTGLGLSSAYGVIKNHGGHIHCYSELGMGTTFNLYLPLAQAHGLAEDEEGNGPAHESVWRGTETVLVVDDEAGLRQLGERTLTANGYRVVTAASGEEALETFVRLGSELDLVVMDLGMPGMGGHKALKAMLAINPRAKVVIASGYSAQGRAKGALEDGAAGYVAKPFRRADLLATVRSALDKR